MLEDFLRLLGLVLEGDAHALVDVADDFEALADRRGVELDLREDRRVRMEVDRRAGAARRARLLERRRRLAALERHLPQHAVALDARPQLGRERVDDARADAVQPAGRLVAAVLELPARVQHGEDDFERALLRLRVLVDRNAAAVVRDGDRAAVGVQRDDDVRRRSRSWLRRPRCRESPRPGGAGRRCRRRRCTCRAACVPAPALRGR